MTRVTTSEAMAYSQFERFVPYRERPFCFCDIETNGTTPGYHEVIEFAAKHEKLGRWSTPIAIEHHDRSEPEALKVSRYNKSDWVGAPTFKQVAPRIAEFLTDATIVGHNFIGFDAPMIRGAFDMQGLSHGKMLRDIIDTMMLARTFLIEEDLKRLNMKACRKFFGKGYERAHAAWEDVEFVEELYNDIKSGLRWHGNADAIQETLF